MKLAERISFNTLFQCLKLYCYGKSTIPLEENADITYVVTKMDAFECNSTGLKKTHGAHHHTNQSHEFSWKWLTHQNYTFVAHIHDLSLEKIGNS